MKYYPSKAKKDRAEHAIKNYGRDAAKHPNKAEYKLAGMGLSEKLEGEELLDFVYKGLSGSPILKGEEAEEAEKKAKTAQSRVKKRGTGAAGARSKITVK